MARKQKKKTSFFTKFIVVAVILYIIGFGFFIKNMPFAKGELDKNIKYDSIIVFTGEGERIAEGLKLYNLGISNNLFISGVFKDLPLEYFFKMKNDIKEFKFLNKSGINYDNFAKNTIDNIISTKLYTKTEKHNKIIVISSFYHIPRIKFLMDRFAEELSVTYHPVFPKNISRNIKNKEFLKISFLEYNKTLVYVFWEILGVENQSLKD